MTNSYIEFCGIEIEVDALEYIFQINDERISIPSGKEIGRDLHNTILSKVLPAVKNVHSFGGRCIVVSQLNEYPTLRVYIDTRNQLEVLTDDDDSFSKYVRKMWTTYDPSNQVPMIYINGNESFIDADIRLIDFWYA